MSKIIKLIRGVLMILMVIPLVVLAQDCNDREYKIFKKYDDYLSANPNIPDEQARATIAKRFKMRPSALKNLYFNCLYRESGLDSSSSGKGSSRPQLQKIPQGDSALTKGLDCRTLGYRYAYNATRAMIGRTGRADWDFVMPARCHDQGDTSSGMRAGIEAASQ